MLIQITALLLATAGLKIEEVIAHETTQQEKELTIEENLHNGKILILSDGSKWEIAPQDLNTTQAWVIPGPMRIEKSTNLSYPYRIVNINLNSSVLARPISS